MKTNARDAPPRRLDAAAVLRVAAHAPLLVFFLGPLLLLYVSAFKSNEAQLLGDLSSWRAFWPTGEISLENFRDVFSRTHFGLAFFNSIFTVTLTVALGIVVNSLLGYALARFRFRGRRLLLATVVALVIVPFEAVALPLLMIINQLPWWRDGGFSRGWLDTYVVQVVPFVANAFSVYLFHQFFAALPRDLEDAARMDGAGPLRIWWSIAMPLARPVVATVAVLQFLARWGDLLWPVMAVRGDRYAPLPLALQTFFGQFPRQWGDVMAFSALATLPTLMLFLAFQRWFVKSAIASGIKG